MIQFKNSYFKYDGMDSKRFDLRLCEIDNSENKQLGLDIDIIEEDGIGDINTFIKTKKKYRDIKITLCKMIGNTPIPFKENELKEINRWLFNHECYKPLEVDGYVLYSLFTKADGWFNCANQGYINLTLRTLPYMFSVPKISPTYVITEKTIELVNTGNVGVYSWVDLDIELIGNTTDIEITNLTLGETFKLEGLDKVNDKYIKVFTENCKYIENQLDKDKNMLVKATSRKYLRLRTGINRIVIKCNDRVKINFLTQDKIQLQ